MNNLDMFIDYGTKMVAMSNETAIVGLVGSGLTRKEIKHGVRKILKRNKLKAQDCVITVYVDEAVVFTKRMEAA